MGGSLRQATNFLNQFFPAQLPRFFYALAFQQLGNRRAAGHGWNTALGAEADVGDALRFRFWLFQSEVLQSKAELQNVSASGVFELRDGVGIFDLTGVSRVLKMIEEFGGIHRAIVMRGTHYQHVVKLEVRDPAPEGAFVMKVCGTPKGVP